MFIAHLPAAYLAAKALFPRFASLQVGWCAFLFAFLFACLLGGLAPDLDLLYFYFVDQRQHHHHRYFSHFPLVWALLLFLALIWLRGARTKGRALLATMFALNGSLHLLLDSIGHLEKPAAQSNDCVAPCSSPRRTPCTVSGSARGAPCPPTARDGFSRRPIVGDIWWLAPFKDQPFSLFTVSARYQPWWLNFILHWSFALELAVTAWAIDCWRRCRQPIFYSCHRSP